MPSTNNSKKRVSVLSKTELQQLRQTVNSNKSSETPIKDDPRSHLKQQSSARTSQWQNTVKKDHERKLKQREERLRVEEEARRHVDEEYAREKEEERAKIVEKAEQLMLCENDKVKNIHSQIINDLILMERELQIVRKKAVQEMWAKNTDEWRAENEKNWERKELDDKEKAKQAELRLKECLAEQSHQMSEKLREKKMWQENKMREGAAIRSQDNEYRAKQAAKHSEDVKEQKKRMEELLLARDLAKEKLKQEKVKKAEELKLIVSEMQAAEDKKNIIKEVEEKYQHQLVERREEISARQHEWLMREARKREEWLSQRVLDSQNKEEQKERERRRRKEEAGEEMKKFFDQIQEAKKKAVEAKKENDLKTRQELVLKLEALELEKKEKRLGNREKAREIEATYGVQLEQKKRVKESEVAASMAHEQERLEEARKEEELLLQYTESLLNEKWMVSNPFKKSATEYVHNATKERLFS